MRPVALFCLSLAIGGAAAAAAACGASNGSTPAPPDPTGTAATPVAIGPCRDGDPADQRHGATCLCCHSDEFGVGGSIDRGGPPVARVRIVDSRGESFELAPNPFANFFRHFPLVPPLRASVVGPDGREIAMQSDAPSADCNRCHVAGGAAAPIHGPP